ncbi:MAG: hypothetical protein AAFO77_13990, partial [Pseudomonadota bacterium]
SRTFKAVLAVTSPLFLAACLSTPPSSLMKLSRLSPLEANPANIRLAVETPSALLVRDGDVRLRITYEASDARRSFVEEYAAMIAAVDRPARGIRPSAGGETRTFIAALTPEDARSMAAAQARVRALRANGDTGKGSITVNALGCALQPFAAGPVRVSTWMQTAPDDDFFVVSRNVDLRKAARQAGRDADLFAPCNR